MIKSCDSSEHFMQKVSIGFFRSLTILKQQGKELQLCSCLDHSSKEHESSSAKTFYHWTTKDPARAFLYIGTSDYTPSIKSTTSLQLLRPGCKLGALEQCDRVNPWALGLKGP